LVAFLEMEYIDDQPLRLDFSNMKIDGEGQAEDVRLCFGKPAISESDLQDRINNLKELIKG